MAAARKLGGGSVNLTKLEIRILMMLCLLAVELGNVIPLELQRETSPSLVHVLQAISCADGKDAGLGGENRTLFSAWVSFGECGNSTCGDFDSST